LLRETLIPKIRARGAIPMNFPSLLKPAAIAATNVPWPISSVTGSVLPSSCTCTKRLPNSGSGAMPL
jgi:hypothetical protein